jgi:thiol-disulfide isomerase/thioredoxin
MRYLCFAAASILLLGNPSRNEAVQPETLAIGAKAPEFNLPGVDGKNYSLDNFKDDKLLAVIFTCNHCPTAQAYEDRIIKLVDQYKPKGVGFVAISPNDPLAVRLDELGYTDLNDGFEEMKIRAAHKGFNFPYLYDGETQSVSMKYGPVSTPHVFLFDQDRKLRFRGRIDSSEHLDQVKTHETRDAIEALLEGRPVPVETTRTFGCSVKWSDKRPSAVASLERWNQEGAELSKIDFEGIEKLVRNNTDRYRLINIWATWCGPCVAEFPELVKMHRMYRQRDFEFVTLSADSIDKFEKVHEFLKQRNASGTNYILDSADVYKMMETVDPEWPGAIPHTILIKPGGGIVYRHTGMIDPLEVRRVIADNIGRTY